jgi:hypothetical protein
MSRNNIIDTHWVGKEFFVTFSVNRGKGTKTYVYNVAEGLAIEGGVDPADLSGKESANSRTVAVAQKAAEVYDNLSAASETVPTVEEFMAAFAEAMSAAL